MDYYQEEIKFWTERLSLDEVIEFTKTHRVEVMLQADCQYHCWIDYKEGSGSDEIALTFIGAIFGAIYKYKNK